MRCALFSVLCVAMLAVAARGAAAADGLPVVLVTHQFTITVFTGEGTASGGGSLFELNGTGAPRWLGSIQTE
jgi:hypothetical protein